MLNLENLHLFGKDNFSTYCVNSVVGFLFFCKTVVPDDDVCVLIFADIVPQLITKILDAFPTAVNKKFTLRDDSFPGKKEVGLLSWQVIRCIQPTVNCVYSLSPDKTR